MPHSRRWLLFRNRPEIRCDIAGSGPSTPQPKGGLRVAEFVTRSSSSDVRAATSTAVALPGFPAITNFSTTLSTSNNRLFAGVLSADIQVGVSYWMTQNLKLDADYRLDAFINVSTRQAPPTPV
jgi:hypothetical protein